jgi:hypothetical protein
MDKSAQRRIRVQLLQQPSHSNNIVTKLFERQRGSPFVSQRFPSSCVSQACQSLRVHQLLTLHDPTNLKYNDLAVNLQKKTRIVEIFAVEELLIVLEECGLSVAFNVGMKLYLFFLTFLNVFLFSLLKKLETDFAI